MSICLLSRASANFRKSSRESFAASFSSAGQSVSISAKRLRGFLDALLHQRGKLSARVVNPIGGTPSVHVVDGLSEHATLGEGLDGVRREGGGEDTGERITELLVHGGGARPVSVDDVEDLLVELRGIVTLRADRTVCPPVQLRPRFYLRRSPSVLSGDPQQTGTESLDPSGGREAGGRWCPVLN